MLSRLTNADFANGRGRYAEMSAWIVCALLVAWSVWLLVRIVWLLIPRDEAADVAPARSATATANATPALSISKWHLYGNGEAPAQLLRNAPATTLALSLRGTLAERDPKTGLAVISDGKGSERAYRVGDEIQDGVKLIEVYPERVVLSHQGAEEVLNLPRSEPGATPSGVAAANVPRGAPAGTPNTGAPGSVGTITPVFQPPTPPGTTANWQQTLEQVRRNPGELANRVQIIPVLEDGKIAGVRLSAGADAALMAQMGLRPSDIVTSVNGIPVDSIQRGQQIMESLKNASRVRVTVTRDGKPTDVTVSLN